MTIMCDICYHSGFLSFLVINITNATQAITAIIKPKPNNIDENTIILRTPLLSL
jgi:hypothetical protein